jgi:hypothetical protein
VRITMEWSEETPGHVTLRQGGAAAARWFGAPFLAVGGYFGYQFVDGALHPGELAWAGWTLLPLFAAAFLVPGWILLVGRRRTRLDAARREVVEELDFLVYTRRISTRVSSDSRVMLRYERGSTTERRGVIADTTVTGFDIHVYLETPGSRLAMLALFSGGQKSEALAFAARAAAFFSVPVEDRMVEGGEVSSGGVVVDRLGPDEAD